MSADDVIPPSPQHRDDEVLQHVLREVRTGRSLDAVMQDAYVEERQEADTHERVFDHPEVAQVVGDEVIAEMRRLLAEAKAVGAGPGQGADPGAPSDELVAEMREIDPD